MKIKKLIIALVIIVVLLICILLFVINYQKKSSYEDIPPFPVETEFEVKIANTLQQVKTRGHFYIIKTCIGQFYTYYSEIFQDPTDGYLLGTAPDTINKEQIKKERIEKLYKLLDEEYIAYKGITLDNLESKLQKVGNITLNIKDMYYIEKEDAISIYVAYGKKKDTLTSEITDFSIMLKVDMENKTFKVLLEDYMQNYYKDLKIGDTIEINENEVKDDTYNKFSFRGVTDEEYVNDLFSDFKTNLRISREESYDLLDENYKNKCFDNLDDYLSYLDANYLKISIAKLDTYNKDTYNGYTQYLLKDTKGNYYIFKETAPFKYTVMLDNYVIPTDYFIEEYNSSSNIQKVILNIKKFFNGIEDEKYGYSYSLLSDSFKNNKYPTKNDFIDYIKQNFFENSKLEYISYKEENGVYIYKVRIVDETGNNSKEFNMIVKLKSGTDFEMSFSEN